MPSLKRNLLSDWSNRQKELYRACKKYTHSTHAGGLCFPLFGSDIARTFERQTEYGAAKYTVSWRIRYGLKVCPRNAAERRQTSHSRTCQSLPNSREVPKLLLQHG